MKKIKLISVLIFISFFANSQRNENISATASKNANGMVEFQIIDVFGKAHILKGDKENLWKQQLEILDKNTFSTSENKKTEIKLGHEAILNPDGTQEIHLTDKTGKHHIIKEKTGENIQLTYYKYLKKEGLECGCGGNMIQNNIENINAKTLIRN